MRNVVIVLAVLALGVPAYGETWVGGNGPTGFEDSWDVGANWDTGNIPPVGSTTVRFYPGTNACKIDRADVDLATTYHQTYMYDGSALELASGYTLEVANHFYLGIAYGTNPDATFTQWGTFQSNYNVKVGDIGKGKWIVKGGTINITTATRDFIVGATGTLRIEGSAASIGLGDYIQNATGTLELDFSGGAAPITEIDAATATLAGTLTVTGTADAGTYTIIDYAGTLTGTFSTVSLPSTDWSINYGDGDDDVVTLTYVPEPATMVLLGLGGIGMLIRRRRK